VRVQDVYGSPTYGRVSGLGTAATSIADSVTFGATSAASSLVGGITSGVKNTMIKLVFTAMGLSLVGYGVYQTSTSAVRNKIGEALA
jgi:hypothetical protein